MLTFKAAGMIFCSAVVMSIGFRIGSDIYTWARWKYVDHQANKLLAQDETFMSGRTHIKAREAV